MLSPALIAGGVQAVGGLFGGRKRRKAAKALDREVTRLSDEAVQTAQREQSEMLRLRDVDQQDMERLRSEDEARLSAASGYDLVKLRNDAVAAGFNPLTVLNATGAAGYDGRGAVLTTPFHARLSAYSQTSDDYWQRAANKAGTGQVFAQTAGYVGDAISAGGSAYFAQRNADAQMQLERERIAALREPVSSGPARSVSNGSPFSDAPVRQVDGSYKLPVEFPPVTGLVSQGQVVKTDAGSSDSAAYQNRYGETVGEVYGIRQFAWDWTAQLNDEFRAMPIWGMLPSAGPKVPAVAPNRALVFK